MDSAGTSPPHAGQQGSELRDVFPVFENAVFEKAACSSSNQARLPSASSFPEEDGEVGRCPVSSIGEGGGDSMLQLLVAEMKAMREDQAVYRRNILSILDRLATEQTRSNQLLQEALYSQIHLDRGGQAHSHHPYMEKIAASLDTIRREIQEIKQIAARASPIHSRLH